MRYREAKAITIFFEHFKYNNLNPKPINRLIMEINTMGYTWGVVTPKSLSYSTVPPYKTMKGKIRKNKVNPLLDLLFICKNELTKKIIPTMRK